MNIFLNEIKYNIKGFIIWSGSAVLLVAGVMGKYVGISTGEMQTNELLSKMPKALQVMIGGGAFDLNDISGYIGVSFGYLLLIASFYAVTLGTNAIIREEREKTAEFLFVKPVIRWRVLFLKLSAGLLCAFAYTAVLFTVVSVFTSILEPRSYLTINIAILFLSMFIVLWLFVFFGAVSAALSKRPRRAGRFGAAYVFFAYLLWYAIQINDNLTPLTPITPFGYFDTAAILTDGGGPNIIYSITSIILGIIFAVIALESGNKRDIII